MDNHLDDLCDKIDAAVFSGDKFLEKENRRGLKKYMSRWKKEIKFWKKAEKERRENVKSN